MERAHVVIRLREAAAATGGGGATGIHRTSETTVRLKHSEMSPGVASITFEQVYDQQHSNAHIFQRTLARSVERAVDGYRMTVVATGASHSGKSFTCHGRKDRAQTEPGIITLSIREVFDVIAQRKDAAPGARYQVLLSCLHVADDQVVDLITDTAIDAALPSEMMEQTLADRSVHVDKAAEAIHLYSQARAKSLASCQAKARTGDFIVALLIESQQSFERPRRGRILYLDICGSSIIEPRPLEISNQDDPINDALSPSGGKPYFSDTHFPVHNVLSRHFGTFLGNSSATFMLVAIQKPAQFQQQAIQSLLYACKAKDIRSTCTIHYLSALPKRNVQSRQLQLSDSNENEGYDSNESSHGSESNVVALSSPISLTSSESTSEITVGSRQTVSVDDDASIGNHFEISKTHLKIKQEMLAQRLRKAYETAKASSRETIAPAHGPVDIEVNSSTDVQTTTVSALHTKADLILKKLLHSPNSMTLPEKMELIHTHAQELEQSLAHETSIKNKCVDRISKLSQTMSFQVIEHEKQITRVLEEKKQIENRLRDMEHKYADVGNEIDSLRSQVNEMRTASVQSSMPTANAAITDQERLILQQFSSRLESTIQEAKCVVDFKDSVIKEVESRLALSNQANGRLERELARVQARLEEEKRSLLVQIRGLERKMTLEQEHVKNVHDDWDTEKAALLAKIAQMTLDHEAQNRQWQMREASYQSALDLEKKNVTDRAQSLSKNNDDEKTKLEQQLLAKTAECVFSQAASKARGRQIERLEFQEERLIAKLAKQKKKMEKKLRLLLNDRKQHRIDSSNQLETAQESAKELSVLQDQLRHYEAQEVIWGRNNQDLESRLRDLQQQYKELEQSNSELRIKVDSLVDEKQLLQDERALIESKFEQQIYDLEQSVGRKVIEKEAQIIREHERKMRKLKKRHSAELLRRDMEVTERCIHGSSSSSSSSAESPVESYSQKSIDQLDAISSANNSSLTCGIPNAQALKKKLSQQEQQVQALDQRAAALTHALALANEQETRAKQQMQQCKAEYEHSLEARDELLQEVNRLKQENWSLNLALQVTERQRK